MIIARSLLFNLAFYLWTAVLGVIALPVLLAPRRCSMWLGRWWSGTVLALLKAIIGLDHELRGTEHLSGGVAIIAMKHQSAWDTLAVPMLIDDAAVVTKRELLWIPVYGWYVRRAGMIAIDRGAGLKALRSMIAQARAVVAQGRPSVIFPEGTRTAVGRHREFRPGVAALYRQLDLPVVPVAVNSGLFWSRRSFVKRPGRIIVEALPPVPPGLDRKKFLAELQERIETATARLVAEAGAPPPG